MSSTSYTHLVDGYISRKKDGNGTVAAQQYISPRVRAAAAAAKKPKPTIEITPTERNNCLPLSKSGASVVAMEGADTVGVREEDGSDESTRLHDETTLPNNSPAIISPALSQVSPTNNTANYTMKKEKTAPVSNNIVGGTSKLDANAVAPKRVYDSQGRPRRLYSTELHSTRPKRKVATAVSEEAIGSSTSVEKKRVWSAGRYHTIPFCSSDGCNSQAINNGVCCRHDGSRKCKHKGCSQWPRKGGLCVEHEGAKVEQYAPPLKMNSGLWSSDEHILFLEGLELHGRNWKKIETVVGSRDFTQVQSHAQKYMKLVGDQLKLSKASDDNRRQMLPRTGYQSLVAQAHEAMAKGWVRTPTMALEPPLQALLEVPNPLLDLAEKDTTLPAFADFSKEKKKKTGEANYHPSKKKKTSGADRWLLLPGTDTERGAKKKVKRMDEIMNDSDTKDVVMPTTLSRVVSESLSSEDKLVMDQLNRFLELDEYEWTSRRMLSECLLI